MTNDDDEVFGPDLRQRAEAMFAALDGARQLAESVEQMVIHLRGNGWTDEQARAIVAYCFGWRPADGSKPEGVT